MTTTEETLITGFTTGFSKPKNIFIVQGEKKLEAQRTKYFMLTCQSGKADAPSYSLTVLVRRKQRKLKKQLQFDEKWKKFTGIVTLLLSHQVRQDYVRKLHFLLSRENRKLCNIFILTK